MKARVSSSFVLAALLTVQAAEADTVAQTEASLPAFDKSKFESRAPQPSWDTGLLMGVCGVGEVRLWQQTRFCLGGVADLLFRRTTEDRVGWGAYGQVSSAGFRDARLALGPSLVVPAGSWLVTTLRAGPLLRFEGGAAPGAQAYLELGQRSVNFKSHYSLSHSLFLGFDWSAATENVAENTSLWIGLRVDAYWLTAPAMLFQL